MLIDFWHYWLLLRPLLVFVLAAPFFMIALVFRGRRQSRSLEGKTADASVLPIGGLSHPRIRSIASSKRARRNGGWTASGQTVAQPEQAVPYLTYVKAAPLLLGNIDSVLEPPLYNFLTLGRGAFADS